MAWLADVGSMLRKGLAGSPRIRHACPTLPRFCNLPDRLEKATRPRHAVHEIAQHSLLGPKALGPRRCVAYRLLLADGWHRHRHHRPCRRWHGTFRSTWTASTGPFLVALVIETECCTRWQKGPPSLGSEALKLVADLLEALTWSVL